MSALGWNILQVSEFGGYTFVYGVPEKRKHRIDYRVFKNQSDFDDYTTLFWDSGWNFISGGKSRGNQYFYSTNLEENCDIFSDECSKAGRYARMAWHTLWITMISFIPYFVLWETGAWNFSLSSYQKYQIAQLPNQTGLEFLNTFLHLAVPLFLQAAFCICSAIMLVLCISSAIKAGIYYRRARKKGL